MGYYVNVEAKDGCEDQINDLWSQSFDDFLIYTRAHIQREIDAIHSKPDFAHMRWIQAVEDWNDAIKIHAEGCGQIFLRAFGYSNEESEAFRQVADLDRRQIQWIMDNRFLFKSITSLQDAADALGMSIDCDAIKNGRPVTYEQDSFATLPVEHGNQVYAATLTHDRPRLWKAFLAYRESPCWDNWLTLRDSAPCGKEYGLTSIWQQAEVIAKQRDGQDYGLDGRYRDGKLPPETDVVMAILGKDLTHRKAG